MFSFFIIQMNCASRISSLVLLVIFCSQNIVSAADVCLPLANETSQNFTHVSVSGDSCTQFCLSKSCNFSCSYDDCAQTCLAPATCMSACFDSKICSQACDGKCPEAELSCQADSCLQTCGAECIHITCNDTKNCTQSCDENCGKMSCHADASCIQSGHGEMMCDSETCQQTCTNSSSCALLHCNASTCKQTCNTKDCSMECTPEVKECTQNCTVGKCSFKCDKTSTKCIHICPGCDTESGDSAAMMLSATGLLTFMVVMHSFSMLF